ncbi:phage baseplate assembly protein V [Methanocella sp. MCL-LM]|uniref:phage baseplate assembly protein V n=1 Tax=Methanocella sp. MCL-LM TaxID=3412035 RepID=UPI003C71E264
MPIEINELSAEVDNSGNTGNHTVGQSDGSENLTLVGTMRRIAETEARKIHTFDLGVVTSIFPHASGFDDHNYYCSVRLRDSDSDELRNVPILTPHIGFAFTPSIGDLVLVGYIGGNVNSPVVLGSMYNDRQRPPENDAGELVFVSPDSVNPSKKRVDIKLPSGVEIKVTDDAVLIDTGFSKINVGMDGTISLKADVDITIESTMALKLKGLTVEIEGTQELNQKGGLVNIESDANAEIKAGANMSVKGGAITEIKGSMVNIN